jgi:hypothetical protein
MMGTQMCLSETSHEANARMRRLSIESVEPVSCSSPICVIKATHCTYATCVREVNTTISRLFARIHPWDGVCAWAHTREP